jgi:hypothetical protein
MKMDIVAGSQNNEYYTPPYAILPLIKYLKSGATIWCPFDTDESYYVKIFRQSGFTVIATHISNGGDFFNTVHECDYIISNPPFSCKGEVLKRLFELKTPFAMLVGAVGIFESKARFNMFKDSQFEICYFSKRISYFKNYSEKNPSSNPPFSSVYVCSKILPKQIVFEEIDKRVKVL